MSIRSAMKTSDIDLFTDDALTDPYPLYRDLRDAGPIVYLTRYDVHVLARYEQVRDALEDWETFSSADGVGLNGIFNQALTGTIIASDPPHHDDLRNVLSGRLSPRALRELRADVDRKVEEHIEELVGRGSFDAVTDLARVIPISIILDLLGFPHEGREGLLEWGEETFNAVGPENRRMQDSLPKMQEMFGWLENTCTRDRMLPGGFATTIHEAADRGEIPCEAVVPLMAGYSIPALDTTVSALASAVKLFAEHPDQWDALRANPSLIPSAFNEVLRLESPVQLFTRVTRREYRADGLTLPAGSRVVVLYGAANRDERQYPDPDRFDIRRGAVDHLAFGYEIHGCAGQGLARLEGHAALAALAKRVERFEITSEPTLKLNNSTRALASLPVAVRTGRAAEAIGRGGGLR
ncbi:cytochrome P450 [Streptomyces sp. NPDC005181]|uniref:cytochrome P450 n=1 Tax=Streptomyces sp. NPDC005181 TaxID=3156869 RepID=UPI0033A91BD5